MEKKILGFEINEIKERKDDSGINVAEISGYAAVTGNLDQGRDRIVSGAFKKGLRRSKGKFPVLVDHHYSMGSVIGENISAKEDDNGLFVQFQVNLDTQAGAETYSRFKHAKSAGRDTGLSIGYSVQDFEFKTVKGVMERHLKAIDVMEFSAVVFPMNPKATVTTVKSICEEGDAEKIAHKKRNLEQLLRDEGGCSKKEAEVAVNSMFAMRDALAEEEQIAAEIKAMTARLKGESNE